MRWRISAFRTAPDFWQNPEPTWMAIVLRPIAAIYGAITALRMRNSGERASQPVICIGNVTAGGAGKTPMALAVAALLRQLDVSAAIVSRGYGGALTGPVVVDPAIHNAADVGDEPLMMAQLTPVIVARHRPHGAELAKATGAGITILDDGLQNSSLIKDFTLAVIDGAVGIGNGLCLPAGPLRAPMDAQWPRIDALIIIGQKSARQAASTDVLAQTARRMGKPVFTSQFVPDATLAEALKGRRVLALAGIGRPRKFTDTLLQLGANVVETAFFGDHHSFTQHELMGVSARASAANAMVVTTQKDAARIGASWDKAQLGQLHVLPVVLRLDDEAGFVALLRPLAVSSGA